MKRRRRMWTHLNTKKIRLRDSKAKFERSNRFVELYLRCPRQKNFGA
jgi:hypothetical protein